MKNYIETFEISARSSNYYTTKERITSNGRYKLDFTISLCAEGLRMVFTELPKKPNNGKVYWLELSKLPLEDSVLVEYGRDRNLYIINPKTDAAYKQEGLVILTAGQRYIISLFLKQARRKTSARFYVRLWQEY